MRNEKGLSLIDMLVAIGIVGMCAVFFSVPQIQLKKLEQDLPKRLDRIASISSTQEKILWSETSLSKSARVTPENDSLCPCTQGGSFKDPSTNTNVCQVSLCQANQDIDFSFYDPTVSPLIKLSGTKAKPAYFLSNGAKCNYPEDGTVNPEKVCAYKVFTSFKAHCSGDQPSCDHADYLIISIEVVPTGSDVRIASSKTQINHAVSLNYPPTLNAISNQSMNLNEKKKIAITGGSGFATESQNFIFERCESASSNVVDVKCYRFIDSIAQIVLTAKTSGTAQITLQINDGAAENFLSSPMSFDVTVSP